MARPTGTDCVKDSRGVAVADFNGDGRLDLIINNNNETPTLYVNDLKESGNAVELKLVGAGGGNPGHAHSSRDALGARVRLTAGGKTMTRQVEAGSGYASESALALHFGLGGADRIDAVEITWPDGKVERLEGETLAALGINRLIRIEEASAPSSSVATVALALTHSAPPGYPARGQTVPGEQIAREGPSRR